VFEAAEKAGGWTGNRETLEQLVIVKKLLLLLL
jgi:hypothetical protein